jgi:hypothetical protein
VEKATRRRDDPFCPKTDDVLESPSEILALHELDRDKLTAVHMVGHGEFGEVYLANQSVPADQVTTDNSAGGCFLHPKCLDVEESTYIFC